MPIFEFVCDDCSHPFEELLRSSEAIHDITCPSCGSGQVKKLLSSFASRIAGGGMLSLSSYPASSCDSGGT